jgi:hypothetical protein
MIFRYADDLLREFERDFLVYANNSLKDDPYNFYKIFEVVPLGESSGKKITDYLLTILTIDSHVNIDSLRPKADEDNGLFETALKTVFHRDDEFCENTCPFRKTRYAIFKENFKENKFKCYECDQIYFVNCLSEIIQGKEYTQIKDFYRHIITSRSSVEQTMLVRATNTNEKNLNTDFKKPPEEYIGLELQHYNKPGENLTGCIEHYFWFSLSEFLKHNDRKLIKRCKLCNQYFIALKNSSAIKYCSDCSPKRRCDKVMKNSARLLSNDTE